MRFLKDGTVWVDIPEEFAEAARQILGKYTGKDLIGKIASLLQDIDKWHSIP